eukprot:3092208-Alexandrium_andersonii.AAC.1
MRSSPACSGSASGSRSIAAAAWRSPARTRRASGVSENNQTPAPKRWSTSSVRGPLLSTRSHDFAQ